MFKDRLASSRGSLAPLSHSLREDHEVTDASVDLLLANYYCRESGRLIYELESRLPHEGPIFKNDNIAACMKIEEAARGMSVGSTTKHSSLRKNGRGYFQVLIENHAGEKKNRSISKK